MLRQLADLESTLQMLVAEHRKLLAFMDTQQAAMRALDLGAMDKAINGQEACRLRISTLETKRRGIVSLLTKGQRVEQPVTITKVAALYPQRRDALLKLRDELRGVATTISSHSKIAGKLAGSVLGHLNTVVRMLAGAVERTSAGTYTKSGNPRLSNRIGVMEAVA
jgi:hypothetical protein